MSNSAQSDYPQLPDGYKWSAHTGTTTPGFVNFTVKLRKMIRVAGIPFFISVASSTGTIRSDDYFMLSERIYEEAQNLMHAKLAI
jgi:hypothetical protein